MTIGNAAGLDATWWRQLRDGQRQAVWLMGQEYASYYRHRLEQTDRVSSLEFVLTHI
jgi:hypothetical protein